MAATFPTVEIDPDTGEPVEEEEDKKKAVVPDYLDTDAAQAASGTLYKAEVDAGGATDQGRRDDALERLLTQAGGTVAAFEKAGPLLQQKLRAGVGRAYQAARGAGGRGAGISGGGLQAAAAAQAGAEAEAASRMADYGVDLAAARTDLDSFTLDLLDAERIREEQKYLDVTDQIQSAMAEFDGDKTKTLAYIQELQIAAAAAGDQELSDFLTKQMSKVQLGGPMTGEALEVSADYLQETEGAVSYTHLTLPPTPYV